MRRMGYYSVTAAAYASRTFPTQSLPGPLQQDLMWWSDRTAQQSQPDVSCCRTLSKSIASYMMGFLRVRSEIHSKSLIVLMIWRIEREQGRATEQDERLLESLLENLKAAQSAAGRMSGT